MKKSILFICKNRDKAMGDEETIQDLVKAGFEVKIKETEIDIEVELNPNDFDYLLIAKGENGFFGNNSSNMLPNCFYKKTK